MHFCITVLLYQAVTGRCAWGQLSSATTVRQIIPAENSNRRQKGQGEGNAGKGLTRVSCGEGGMVDKMWVAYLKACTILFLAAPATTQGPREVR